METSQTVWILGGAAIVAVVTLVAVYILKARQVKSIGGAELYEHKPGEQLAAPFAEQIEDALHASLSEDPTLAALDVDLGTGPDGGLEVWVEGKRYADVDLVPNERLRQLIGQAIESWEQAREEQR